MSEIERIQAAAAHPENWKPVKRSHLPARRELDPLQSLLTSWPGSRTVDLLPRATAEALAEREEHHHGK